MMNSYHKDIRKYLINTYLIPSTDIEFKHGTNHPYFEFTFNGKRCTIRLQGNQGDKETQLKALKEQDIRRLLGEPPEKPEKQKRSLEQMTQELETFALKEGDSTIQILPNLQTQPTKTYHGKISCYPNTGVKTGFAVRFFIPQEIAKDFTEALSITLVDDETWSLKKGGIKKLTPCKNDKSLMHTSDTVNVPKSIKSFSFSPLEILEVDGGLLLHSKISDRVPVKSPRQGFKKKVTLKKFLQEAPPLIKSASVMPLPETFLDAPVKFVPVQGMDHTESRMKFVLKEIKDLEKIGPRRLVKLTSGKWRWRADDISLDEEE